MITRKPFNSGKTNIKENFKVLGEYFLQTDREKIKEHIGKDKKFWGEPKYVVLRTELIRNSGYECSAIGKIKHYNFWEGFQQIAPFDTKKEALEYMKLSFEISNVNIVDVFMIEI